MPQTGVELHEGLPVHQYWLNLKLVTNMRLALIYWNTVQATLNTDRVQDSLRINLLR